MISKDKREKFLKEQKKSIVVSILFNGAGLIISSAMRLELLLGINIALSGMIIYNIYRYTQIKSLYEEIDIIEEKGE